MIDGATYRRILDEALTNQIDRYRAKGRSLFDAHAQKLDRSLRDEADGYFALARIAEQIREAVREEAG